MELAIYLVMMQSRSLAEIFVSFSNPLCFDRAVSAVSNDQQFILKKLVIWASGNWFAYISSRHLFGLLSEVNAQILCSETGCLDLQGVMASLLKKSTGNFLELSLTVKATLKGTVGLLHKCKSYLMEFDLSFLQFLTRSSLL